MIEVMTDIVRHTVSPIPLFEAVLSQNVKIRSFFSQKCPFCAVSRKKMKKKMRGKLTPQFTLPCFILFIWLFQKKILSKQKVD